MLLLSIRYIGNQMMMFLAGIFLALHNDGGAALCLMIHALIKANES